MDQHLPAHPEVNEQRTATIQQEPHVLSPALNGLDAGAVQKRDELRSPAGLGANGAGVADVDVVDDPTAEMFFQPPADDLHLRQLRHAC